MEKTYSHSAIVDPIFINKMENGIEGLRDNILKKMIWKLLLVFWIIFSHSVYSQQVNTMYFMDNVPFRNYLNPAFQPYSDFYLGLPVIGYSQIAIGNNSVTMRDIIYNINGTPVFMLDPSTTVDNFYNALRSVTTINADVQLNLLNFGFRTGRSYWNLSLTERVDGAAEIPKDLMKLALYGTQNINTNSFNLKPLGLDMSVYTEAGLGYAFKINDKLDVGAKLKFLIGTANVNLSFDQFDLQAGIDQWTLKGQGTLNAAIPGDLQIGSNFKSFNYNSPNGILNSIMPNGYGAGIDFGASYKIMKQLTLSAALTDIGFINWNNHVDNIGFETNFMFSGLGKVDILNGVNMQAISDSILTALKNSSTATPTNNAYTTYTSPKLNIGAEYAFFDNKLTVGLLSRTIKHQLAYNEELTASVNGKPIDWFDLSLSYSIFNGRFSNIGVGAGLRTGFLHWFLAADYVPLRYATLPLSAGSPVSTAYLPSDTKGINLAFGLSFVFGNRKDADKDGVIDRLDKCPNTPKGVKVDKHGCPIDSDGDGVPDYLDKCPNTPIGVAVDSVGCPLDTDGDGIPDYLDKCPNTPKGVKVDSVGCPLDTDGDGIPDYLDKCPDTPKGVKVDSVGCPFDTDGDGVPDYLDKCPDTPKAAWGHVDASGCPLDTDGDGVPDYLDKCPDTPKGIKVDSVGCPFDSDGDGVPDYLDKCPDTPKGVKVDSVGCPIDTDGDGIPDYLDNCPTIPGVASNHGCPEVKKEVRTLFQKALQGIQFQTGKAVILKKSYDILNRIAKVMADNPTYTVEIQGHTDNVGNPQLNVELSDKRANSVREYLIAKGVDPKRMTSRGYGDTRPVASNKTAKGRALNRRVEFVVSFEEMKME